MSNLSTITGTTTDPFFLKPTVKPCSGGKSSDMYSAAPPGLLGTRCHYANEQFDKKKKWCGCFWFQCVPSWWRSDKNSPGRWRSATFFLRNVRETCGEGVPTSHQTRVWNSHAADFVPSCEGASQQAKSKRQDVHQKVDLFVKIKKRVAKKTQLNGNSRP